MNPTAVLPPEELRFAQTAALRIAYLESGNFAMPTVVFLHGYPDTAMTWKDVMHKVSASGFRCIAPYLRGYAPTEIPKSSSFDPLTLAKDLYALLDALEPPCKLPVVLVGHDWGAYVAMTAANLAPERVHRLVTLSIPHARAINEFRWRAISKATHFLTYQLPGVRYVVSRNNFAHIRQVYRDWAPNWDVSEAELLPVRYALAQPGGLDAILGYYWCWASGWSEECRSVLEREITVPTLCFAGKVDGALDYELCQEAAKYFLRGYTFVCLGNGVGHFPHREAKAEFLLEFLKYIKEQ